MYPWSGDDKLAEVLKVIDPKCTVKPSIEAYEWARDRLILWQVKSQSCQYHPEIEATLSLISAVLKDRQLTSKSDVTANETLTNKCYDICTFYGMSIVKFCNLLPFYEMNKKRKIRRVIKKSKKTVRDLGIALDLPSWVLECRHATCHASTNSLVLLRQANHFALSWIFKHFWSKMMAEEEANRQNDDSDVLERQIMKWLRMTPGSKRAALRDKIANNAGEHPVKSWPLIVDILVRESSDKLSSTTVDLGELPIGIVKSFAKVIRLIGDIDNLELVLNHLASHFTNSDTQIARTSVLWFKLITKCLGNQGDEVLKEILGLPELDPEVAIVIWQRLLYKATRKLTQFTPELIDHLTNVIPENCASKKAIMILKQLSLFASNLNRSKSFKSSETVEITDSNQLHTIADICRQFEVFETKMDTS